MPKNAKPQLVSHQLRHQLLHPRDGDAKIPVTETIWNHLTSTCHYLNQCKPNINDTKKLSDSWYFITSPSAKLISVSRAYFKIVYINHISIIYQSYINHISIIYQSYINHISVIYQSYINHISIIYQSYINHISVIYQSYINHILIIYQSYISIIYQPYIYIIRYKSSPSTISINHLHQSFPYISTMFFYIPSPETPFSTHR